MVDDEPLSKRAAARRAAQERRAAKAALHETSFEALAAGWSVQQIAAIRNVSVRTIQREIDSALAERRLDAPDRFVHLQVARLTKALRVADSRLDRGQLAAVGPFVKVVAALDRYHRLTDPPTEVGGQAIELRLRAPPLALTHAAPESEPVDAA